MVLKSRKGKSSRKKTSKKKNSGTESWLLPAALAFAFGGGLAAIMWPAPEKEPVVAATPAGEKSLPERAEPVHKPVKTLPMPEVEMPDPDVVAEPRIEYKSKPPAAPRFDAKVAPVSGAPRVAIVLDDMGLDQAAARRAANLPEPVTLAFLPYAKNLQEQTANARKKGHELMVHMPMEPTSSSTNPGPNALRVGLDEDELKRRMESNLEQFSGYVGFNNHMGSRFTADQSGMSLVIAEARERGLLFLDSRTTEKTVGAKLAQSMGVPYAARDVFLDNNRDPAAIRRQLGELGALAQKHGSAIAIGHPYPETLAVLEVWLRDARTAGYEIVPLSSLVKSGQAIAAKPTTLRGDRMRGDGS